MPRLICALILAVLLGDRAFGDEPPGMMAPLLESLVADDSLMTKTLGGRQFWGDVYFFHGWRIQQNVFTKHYRLLDASDHRHAFGSLQDCRDTLNAIRIRDNLPPMTGTAVICLHGILRSSKCMNALAQAATDRGFHPIRLDYPSTQISIPEAAEYLHQAIESLEGVDQIYIAAHSMGGLVTRAYFAKYSDPRIKRVVMIGTPNHGAELADLLHQFFLVRAASGPGGRQLVTDPDGLIPSLPVPSCEFAVIAGARGHSAGWNPFLPGDDDGTVTVDSTRLAGATDFSTVAATHTFMVQHPETIEQTYRFFAEGRLKSDRSAEPIVVRVASNDVLEAQSEPSRATSD